MNIVTINDGNLYNIDGEQLVRLKKQGLRVSVENIPSEVKDRIVWAALVVEIAYGNGDIEPSQKYAVDALDCLSEAAREAERYGTQCEIETLVAKCPQ